MKIFILVGLGGALGAMSRHAIAGLLNSPNSVGGFPVGTLLVNILGCFCIGLLAKRPIQKHPKMFTRSVPTGNPPTELGLFKRPAIA